MIENPFELILNKLNRVEMILADLQKQQPAKQSTVNRSEYLTVEEAANFLSVSPGSIYRYVMTGVLPKRKFGNKLYFSKETLQNLIDKGVKP